MPSPNDTNEYDDASTFESDVPCPECGCEFTRWTGYIGDTLWHECDCGAVWGYDEEKGEVVK